MRIFILNGHPDPAPGRLCQALADAYAEGARTGGHEVRRLAVGGMELPLLRSEGEFNQTTPPPAARQTQEALEWAEHWVLIYPLWLGTMPAATKALLEQTLRPGFATDTAGRWPGGRLQGRSARVVVTMGMPALAYRWWFGAHSLKSLERNILKFCGIGPVRETLYGMVAAASARKRQGWLAEMRSLGERGR
ncbi:MAG: NAD(P)H-dependent oxidoreductase [Alphaproteobacteria bacterium]|nr:NAD(P)H-dependent oxidoreductase [Alphaproteobacteria bacterium]MCB9930830.1 NAD(P)H-dependent oxidoreductase [Alphaproteobacteria bacterium]